VPIESPDAGLTLGNRRSENPLDRRGSVNVRTGGARFRRATPVVAADTGRTSHDPVAERTTLA
jgi:hypothetical protein